MRVWCQIALAGLLAVVVPAADAQTRVVTVPASTATSGAARILSAPSARVESTLTGGYPVSGLGFDYAHHAAVNRGLATRAVIDPATQHQLALARQLRQTAPVTGVVPVVFPVINNTIVIVQAPPVIVQAPPPTIIIQQAPAAATAAANSPAEPAVLLEPPPPHRELDEIVLVRVDGGLLFAVGYSQRGDRLIYITPQGLRRSVKLAEIDVEFTLRLNEERGTFL
ncbi:MAG TPA: hypothetical protein VGA40_00850, partial [Candidatus Acidoferrales bacterium]